MGQTPSSRRSSDYPLNNVDYTSDFQVLSFESMPDLVVAPLVERFWDTKNWVTMTATEEGGDSPSKVRRRKPKSGSLQPLALCKGLAGRNVLLSDDRINALRQHLPIQDRYASTWKLIYCPHVHGVSLRTLYRQCTVHTGPTLMLFEDSDGIVFGGYTTETWKCAAESMYYGGSSCFVFTFPENRTEECFVFNSCGHNRFYMLSDMDSLSMGGGDNFAFWISSDFLRGSSAESSTFMNTPLAKKTDFVLRNVECWAFEHPMGNPFDDPQALLECRMARKIQAVWRGILDRQRCAQTKEKKREKETTANERDDREEGEKDLGVPTSPSTIRRILDFR